MIEVPLRGGLVAQIDDQDYDLVSGYKWTARRDRKTDGIYAVGLKSGMQNAVLMHRIILGAGPGEVVDHADRNGLNNTRANIRICTYSQNQQNAKKRKNRSTHRSSKYKGVSWKVSSNKWRAQIKSNGQVIDLGLFVDELEAAHAYDKAAREVFGIFSRPNFPTEGEL